MLGGLDDGGAQGGGAEPAAQEVGCADEVVLEGLGVDDVGDGSERDGRRGGIGLEQTEGSDLDALGLDVAGGCNGDAVLEDGELACGAEGSDFGEGNGELAGHVAFEHDGAFRFAEEGAAELVAVGEQDDVFGGRLRGLLRGEAVRKDEEKGEGEPAAKDTVGQ